MVNKLVIIGPAWPLRGGLSAFDEKLATQFTEKGIQTRIDKAEYEISFSNQFNAIIKNEVLATACEEAANILIEFLGPEFTK